MSNNQEKLNEQLFNVIADEKVSDEAKLKKVKYLVRLGADVNARFYGKSVLSKAIEQNAGVEVVEFLREKGANEWIISKEEAKKLSQGFWDDKGYFKSLEEIKELLKKGANVNARNKYGETALMKAAIIGQLDVVKCLVECRADLDVKDGVGRTALIKAVIWGQLAVVKCLVELAADLEAKDGDGRTALMKAARFGYIKGVKYLVECGADFEAKDKDGRTALDFAKDLKRADCVKFLEEWQQKGESKVEVLSGKEKNTTVKKRGMWQRIFGGRD